MANKIKVFVVFLALIASFSVLAFFNSFSHSPVLNKTASIVKSSLTFDIDPDTDKDGLTNKEESYWNTDFNNPDSDGDGYMDGEEVVSGHDPLIKAPNDVLDNGNLTDKMTNLTLAGLYEGSLRSDSADYQESIDMVASSIAQEAVGYLSEDLQIEIRTVDSNKANQEAYIKTVSPLIGSFMKTYSSELTGIQKVLAASGNSGFSDSKLITFFKNNSDQFTGYFEAGTEMAVPKNWESNHFGLLKLMKDLAISNLAVSKGKDDPIKATLALSRIAKFLDIMPELLGTYADKIESEKLNTRGTIFEK